jgi:small subunit ribosomal protein S13
MLYLLRIFLSKKIFIQRSLRKVFGIGLTRSKKIVSLLGLHPSCNLSNLFDFRKRNFNQFKLNKLSLILERSFSIDYVLKRLYSLNINNLKNKKCYRGFRHYMLLPTRGQRSHTNASSFRKVVEARRSIKKN